MLDRKQLHGKGETKQIFYEALVLMWHIPPFSFGLLSADYDAWNIIGTMKLYLLAEVLKINHPLWKQRYEINAGRIKVCRPPYLIGSFFCLTESLSQFHPLQVFFCIL